MGHSNVGPPIEKQVLFSFIISIWIFSFYFFHCHFVLNVSKVKFLLNTLQNQIVKLVTKFLREKCRWFIFKNPWQVADTINTNSMNRFSFECFSKLTDPAGLELIVPFRTERPYRWRIISDIRKLTNMPLKQSG